MSSHSMQLDLSMLTLKLVTLVVKWRNNVNWPIQGCWGLFDGILCCTSGFKLMHHSFLPGGAWHIGYAKVCQSLVSSLELRLVFGKRLNKEWPWTGMSSHSMQLDLSMLTLKLVTLVVKWRNNVNWPIQGCWGLFDQILCCTSGFKPHLMHHSFLPGGAWHIGYAKVCKMFSF